MTTRKLGSPVIHIQGRPRWAANRTSPSQLVHVQDATAQVLPLSFEKLTEVHQVLSRLGLSRTSLLVGLNPAFIASLPLAGNESEQQWLDLNMLNRGGQLADGAHPLQQFLRAAIQLAGPRSEVQELQAALAMCEELLNSPPAPAYPDNETQILAERLQDAYARRDELRAAQVDTHPVDSEILSLRRQLREGGQLRAGGWLSDGRFLLLKPIGHGGFGTVWEALDKATNQRVAIKVLHPAHVADQVRRERFFRGARTMQSLAEAGAAVVRIVLPEGEDGGFYYFVMELMTGDLQVFAERLSPEQAVRLLLPICTALGTAHQRGLVHRDVKPSNILLASNGDAKLSDFDLVGGPDTTGGTRTGGGLGTAVYAAPEQHDNAKYAGPPADVYSLAMTLIHTIGGISLSMANILSHGTWIVDKLSCGAGLKAVLRKALDVDPNARFQDAAALHEALQASLHEGTVNPPSTAILGLASFVPLHRTLVKTVDLRQIVAQRRNDPPRAQSSDLAIDMISLPSGQFLMGASDKDGHSHPFERPQHAVIVEAFELSKHVITEAQLSVVTGKPLRRQGNCPAVDISWFEAVLFCNTLSQLHGLEPVYSVPDPSIKSALLGEWAFNLRADGFRLPTEAEWEYACRAGSRNHWCFGGDDMQLDDYAWYGKEANTPLETVGARSPNAFGFYDMHGLVWEWCNDNFGEYGKPSQRSDERAIRGGSLFSDKWFTRSAARRGIRPATQFPDLGFRCARTLTSRVDATATDAKSDQGTAE